MKGTCFRTSTGVFYVDDAGRDAADAADAAPAPSAAHEPYAADAPDGAEIASEAVSFMLPHPRTGWPSYQHPAKLCCRQVAHTVS